MVGSCVGGGESEIRCDVERVNMALTKADLAEKLFEELGLNKREAKEVVEAFFEELRNALEDGKQINYRSPKV